MIISIKNRELFFIFFQLYDRSILNFMIITIITIIKNLLIIRIQRKNMRSLLIKTSERIKGYFANFLWFYRRGKREGFTYLRIHDILQRYRKLFAVRVYAHTSLGA